MDCEQCGRSIVEPRKGGQRKRFCNSSCRGRWHRSHKGSPPPQPAHEAPASPAAAGGEEATLRDLYDRLRKDVETHGSMVEGPNGTLRLNPAVGELRRVTVDLVRMAERRVAAWIPPPAPEREEAKDGDELAGFLRAVS